MPVCYTRCYLASVQLNETQLHVHAQALHANAFFYTRKCKKIFTLQPICIVLVLEFEIYKTNQDIARSAGTKEKEENDYYEVLFKITSYLMLIFVLD